MISCYMLDVHIANRCNLNCDGCNHWSNYGFKEIFSAETLKSGQNLGLKYYNQKE